MLQCGYVYTVYLLALLVLYLLYRQIYTWIDRYINRWKHQFGKIYIQIDQWIDK